ARRGILAERSADVRGGTQMGKLAFLFPGQGSQKVGMAADLKEAKPDVYDRYFGLAEETTGMPIGQYALEGPEQTLTRTDGAQASEAGIVAPANLNTPAQIVVSGEVSGVERLMELATEAGADKVVRLQVGAAFHSELMKPTQAKMAEAMQDVEWRDPRVPMA